MIVKKSEMLRRLCGYFPPALREALAGLDERSVDNLCEIRLRGNRPVVLIFTDKTGFVTSNGRFTEFKSTDLMVPDCEAVREIFTQMCKFSVYSMTENICDGFITADYGCRVGVYGTAVVKNGAISSVREIKGLNIRLSGFYNGVADKISELYLPRKVNLLICGPPSCGKTTVLKDLALTLSDRFNYKIAVIDERAEFAAEYLGFNTDVLTSYPKARGIQIAVRTLSPDIIICDELGDTREVHSVLDGLNCGVNFVLSVHCRTFDELKKKEQFRLLRSNSSLDYCAFIKDKSVVDKIYGFGESEDEDGCIGTAGVELCAYR